MLTKTFINTGNFMENSWPSTAVLGRVSVIYHKKNLEINLDLFYF
jgi:hypothetical protein